MVKAKNELGILKERVKLEKAQLKTAKFEEKRKEKKARKWAEVKKQLSKRMKSKRVSKPSSVTVKIKESQPAEYVSRFFKDEIDEAKKSMFFH